MLKEAPLRSFNRLLSGHKTEVEHDGTSPSLEQLAEENIKICLDLTGLMTAQDGFRKDERVTNIVKFMGPLSSLKDSIQQRLSVSHELDPELFVFLVL